MSSEKMGLIILAGGKSSRMGSDKAFLKLGKHTLIETIISNFNQAGLMEVTIVTNNADKFSDLEAKVVEDYYPGSGPLAGIHSGLINSNCFANYVVPCDMPFISSAILDKLLLYKEDYDVVVPTMNGKFQPLAAIYTKECIKHIEYLLKNNITKVIELYGMVKTCYVELEENLFFFNINTPEDYLEAQRSIMEAEKNGENFS
ncbi:MAG: molybdenum cofactor guanylyltransferase [Bacillota bacterium]